MQVAPGGGDAPKRIVGDVNHAPAGAAPCDDQTLLAAAFRRG
jgi:hypothetical protein